MGRPVIVAGNAEAFGPEPGENGTDAERDAPAGSFLAGLRAQAEAQRQARHLELPVGGKFGDSLVIRYRMLTRHEFDQYAALLTPNVTRAGEIETRDVPVSALNARMMAAACETVLYEGEDLGVQLDGKLAELLGHPLPDSVSHDDLTAPEIVEGVFGGNWMAIGSHAGRLAEWQRNPDAEAEPGEA